MRIYTVVFCLIAYLMPVQAQKLDHVLGDILVRMEQGKTPEDLIKDFPSSNQRNSLFTIKKSVSTHMNIWLIHCDPNEVNERVMLQAVKQHDQVVEAQVNHVLTMRETVPDDPMLFDQWQYVNTGQGGGLPDADIDADFAWDHATGGLTATGDTIVVCIVDDGADLDHVDLEANIWKNHAEIPGNGVDDDNNGYVDDYRGWDTGSETDEVGDGGSHGTPVAGIVGAKGNNGIGVTGVSWDVKLMIVQGGTGVESEVLAAYSYPLAFRKLYNETNGAQGAFVVATNSSWGVDFGQPEDAPLWCAFYDTLGVHGILSCGATINNNTNVDLLGDLPTACSSDYLISVTNMNRNDAKVNFAGYGIETIDLGAFGEGTWTIARNDGYNSFGGTSGASPHVAGAIGLLYSAPCSGLLAKAKADPGQAALDVRDYILFGVDPNASLEGRTVTGGRLNLHNSIQLLLENCGPCPAPFSLAASDLTDTQAELSWGVTDSTIQENLRWRQLGDTIWNVIADTISPILLTDLLACNLYEFQVEAVCADTTEGYSGSFEFATDGCCELPDQIILEQITDESATFSWSSVLAAEQFIIFLEEDSLMQPIMITTSEQSITFSDLMPCTGYSFSLQTDCDTAQTTFSDTIVFMTSGCGVCTDSIYCEASANNSSEEWIDSLSFGDIQNMSGNNGGYAEFTDFPTAFEGHKNYPIAIVPGFADQSFDEWYRVWIDLNGDGDFEDDGEMVLDIAESIDTTLYDTIHIPFDATPGYTRMRVAMRFDGFNGTKPSECGTYQFGEIEDYCIVIIPTNPPCDAAEMTAVRDVALNEATAIWETVANSILFNYRYRIEGEEEWEEFATLDTAAMLSGLEKCSDYELQIRTICPSDTSAYSESFLFETQCDVATKDEARLFEQLTLYPNPFVDQISLEMTTNETGRFDIQIYDLQGKLMQADQFRIDTPGEFFHQIDRLDALQAGIYLVRISNGLKSTVQKVVKG